MNRFALGLIVLVGCSQQPAKPVAEKPIEKAPTPAVPAPPQETWSDASKGPIDFNGISLEVISVKVGFTETMTLKGQVLPVKQKKANLLVTYRVKNSNDTKRLSMPAWGMRIWDAKGGPELRDEFDNKYERIGSIGNLPVKTSGQMEGGKTLNAGDAAQDMLVFPEPIPKAETLKLDLPGDIVGVSERVKILIPKQMWR